MPQSQFVLCPGNANGKFEAQLAKINERKTELSDFRETAVSRSPTGMLRDEVTGRVIRSSFELSVTYPARKLVKIHHAQFYQEDAVIASKIKVTHWDINLTRLNIISRRRISQ